MLFAAALPAQDTTELLNRMKAMEDRIHALEAEVQTLKGQPAAAVVPQPPPPVAAAPVVQPPPVDAASAGRRRRRRGQGAQSRYQRDRRFHRRRRLSTADRHTPSLEMHESEVGFQEVIDPYARADFFITFGEQGVDLEEGYLTFTSLPAGLQLKVGKMRAAFGKVNTLHNHVLPWTDRPLVTQNLVGGEDGIDDAGLSLSRILPSPKGLFLEGTAQVFRGDSENVFQATRRSDVSTVGHLRGLPRPLRIHQHRFRRFLRARPQPVRATATNQLYGVDATLRWKPLRRAIYHSFVARSEFIWARTTHLAVRQRAPLPAITPRRSPRQALRLLRLGRLPVRAALVPGRPLRPLRARPVPADQSADASHACAIPSPAELLAQRSASGHRRLRAADLLAQRVQPDPRRSSAAPSYGEGRTANEFLFQFQFSMGAHGAHPF